MHPKATAEEVWKCPTAKDAGESVEQRPTRPAFPGGHSEPQGMWRLATSVGSRHYLDLIFWNTFATVAGLPATAALIGRTPHGLPVGVQILAPNFEDATAIDFAARMAEVAGGFVAPPGFD